MSHDLFLRVRQIPDGLLREWRAALAAEGIDCEFHPDADIADHYGFFPVKLVRVAGRPTEGAKAWSKVPVLCGFTLNAEDFRPETAGDAPPAIAKELAEARVELLFSTGEWRTVADYRLQCLGAATLAALTGGVLEDPQNGGVWLGAEALPALKEEVDAFEAAADDKAWKLKPFKAW